MASLVIHEAFTMQKMIRRVQRAYPQIWFACHVEHRTRRNEKTLTDRDAGILEHIDASPGLSATALGAHLGIGKSSMSAHLKRLLAAGWLVEERVGREKHIRLTASAEALLIDVSPLDAERVGAVLNAMSVDERQRALEGLELFSSASKRIRQTEAARN